MLAQISPRQREYGGDVEYLRQLSPLDVTENLVFEDKQSTVVSKLNEGSYKNYV